jgi:hypothetical protein
MRHSHATAAVALLLAEQAVQLVVVVLMTMMKSL